MCFSITSFCNLLIINVFFHITWQNIQVIIYIPTLFLSLAARCVVGMYDNLLNSYSLVFGFSPAFLLYKKHWCHPRRVLWCTYLSTVQEHIQCHGTAGSKGRPTTQGVRVWCPMPTPGCVLINLSNLANLLGMYKAIR